MVCRMRSSAICLIRKLLANIIVSNTISQATRVLHERRLIGKPTAFGYLAMITFLAVTILWSVLVASSSKRKICLPRTNLISVSYWAIPFAWALFVFGLGFTVKDRRRKLFAVFLSLLLVGAIFLFLKIVFKDICKR
jgi:uncharacterized BrkB/YihY/UPF0761 family membrane protein